MTHRNNMYPNPTGLTNNYYNTNPYQTHMNAHPKVNNREAVVSKNRDTSDIERELFVGDLSFFCRAHHLEDLFNQYGTVLSARIQLSEKKSRHSLMYGFVKMESADQAKNAITALNGILFMGRTMR